MRGNHDPAPVRLNILDNSGRPRTGGNGLALSPWVLPAGSAAAAFLLFAAVLLTRDDRLLTQAYDQAFFEQVVWNVGHASRFESGFTHGNFLGLHFEPLLLLPAVMELVWPDSRLLTVLNALGLAGAAPAGFLLARALLPSRPLLAAALAAPLPVWSAVQQAAIAQFHPEALALPAALAAGWAGVTGRTPAMWVLAILALAAKEDQSYTILVIGLLVAATGRRRTGVSLACLATAWGVVVVAFVMPALRGGTASDVGSYYSWLPAASPQAITNALFHYPGLLAFTVLVVGMAGMPLLRPPWLLLAVPPLLADLLSSHSGQADLKLHYGLLLVVPVFVAGLMGARALAGGLRNADIVVLIPALVVAWVTSPLVLPAELPALDRLRACTHALPAAAPVAADDAVAAPLAARPLIVPTALAAGSMYIVVDRTGREPAYVDRAGRMAVINSLGGDGRKMLCDDGRFQLWSPATS